MGDKHNYIIHKDNKLLAHVLPALPNWLKQVYWPFGTKQHNLDICPDQPARNWMYQREWLAKVLLFNLNTVG